MYSCQRRLQKKLKLKTKTIETHIQTYIGLVEGKIDKNEYGLKIDASERYNINGTIERMQQILEIADMSRSM